MPTDEFGLLKNVFGAEDKPGTVSFVSDEATAREAEQMHADIVASAEAMQKRSDRTDFPTTIFKAPSGHTVNTLPNARLIQLTPDRIINVADIREARRVCKDQVMINIGCQHMIGYREHFPDPDGRLWAQLEMAATHAIVISTPNSLPASQAEMEEFLKR